MWDNADVIIGATSAVDTDINNWFLCAEPVETDMFVQHL